MSSQAVAASIQQHGAAADSAWSLLRAASALADTLEREGCARVFWEDEAQGLRFLSSDGVREPDGNPDCHRMTRDPNY